MSLETFQAGHDRLNRAGWPNSYWGERGDWLAVLGQSRDSDTIERSNFRVAVARLESINPDCYAVESESHCLVGWVETLLVDPTNAAAVAEAEAIRDSLAQYPILCEDDLSELETEELGEAWEAWGRRDAIEQTRKALAEVFADWLGEFAELIDVEWQLEELELAAEVDAARDTGREYVNGADCVFDFADIALGVVENNAEDIYDKVIDAALPDIVADMRLGDAEARRAILELAPEASDFWTEAFYMSRD